MEAHTSGRHGKFPIAIVGIGCRMPGGVTSPEEFWDVLVKGRDMVSEIPPDRWSIESFYHKNQSIHSKMVTKRCGFIKDIDKFDNSFFQISPREAASMDPQQRHMLEVTYEAFQDAGIIPSTCGESCGVYIAVGRMDYPIMIMDTSITNPYTLTGIAHSVVANRISYVFNFKGPSLVVDTACASSFTAMHLACCALWNGECELVVAGGANPVIIPEVTVGYSALGVLSPEGMSCPFSDTAKGYVRSEGWGAFILKPLDAALRDNDHIYGLIQGSAIASNGASKSLTMPCSETQKMVMRMAYERFDIPMSSVQYVEAHGTGTPVGDPIEARAIGETFGKLNKQPIRIGSVKSNFGHTECASGVTSAIKVALMLEKKQIVPSINFNKINPSINLKSLNISIQTRNEPIEKQKTPYRVGLNSFGFAGAVAHMIFQEAPKKINNRITSTAGWKFGDDQSISGKHIIVPLSAKSPEALKDLAKKWQCFGSDLDALHIASWQATRREHHTCRLAIVADSSQTFLNSLACFLQDESTDKMVFGEAAHSRPKICFVFPGQGQQWYNMGRQLYEDQPIFRDSVNECDGIFTRLSGWSLLEKTGIFITAKKTISIDIIERIEILQPSINFLQIGLFRLWQHWGVYPDMVVGHSLGEVAAAYAANALSLEEAISVVYYRSVQQATLEGTGSMAAVRSNIETAQALCRSHPNVYIAAINGPDSITISGDCDSISAIVNGNPDKAKQLRVSAAYHSPHMAPIGKQFRTEMECIIQTDTTTRTVPFYSSVTGKCCKDPLNVDYWWENIRKPVLFQSAIESVLQDTEVSCFLEVSATATLRSDVQKISNLYDPLRLVTIVASGRRNANDQQYALLALGSLYTMGAGIKWKEATQNAAHWAPIPTYPWQHQQSLWIEAEDHQKLRLGLDDRSFKGKNGYITTDTFPFLSEYYEDDVPVFPSSGLIEYVTEVVFDDRNAIFENVQFTEALSWSSNSNHRQTALKLDMKRVASHVEITVKETSFFKATIWEDVTDITKEMDIFEIDEVLERCTTSLCKDDFYHKLEVIGITTGPVLQAVEKVYLGDSESLTYLSLESDKYSKQHTFITRLTAALQVSIVTVQQPTMKYRPVSIESLTFQTLSFTDSKERLVVYTDILDCDGHGLTSNILIVSESGTILGKINSLKCRNLDSNRSAVDVEQSMYTTCWQPASARNLPTSVIAETFEESVLETICGGDMDAIQRAEEVADDIEDICVSYIKHALETVPEVERAKTKRYHKYMAIFDAVLTRYTKDTISFDKIPTVIDKILTHCPELEVEMRLTKRLGEALPDTLRNPHTCVPIMFSPDCLDRYFWDGLSMKIYYMAAADTIVRSIKEALKSKQVVRVLELGARIGGMTRFIVEPLKEFGMAHRLEYVFTDVSATFFRQARTHLPEYPFIHYQVLNIEKGVTEQGYVSGSFDIVIGLDTLHVAVDARRSTGFLSDLLTQDGLLYIIEGTNTHYLTELWFGTMDVCLVFEDDRTQIRNRSCWFHREGWMQVMRDIGLQDVVSASSRNEFYHSVMVGRKPILGPAKPVNDRILSAQNRLILILEDIGTSQEARRTVFKDTSIVNNEMKTLGEEVALAYNGKVRIKSFSEIEDLLIIFKKIQHPIEIVYIHSEDDNELKALLQLLQIAGSFPRKLRRLWVIVRDKTHPTNPYSASVLGLAQALCNRTRSVQLCSLEVDSTCKSSKAATDFLSLRRQIQPPDRHYLISQDSIQVPRTKNHKIEMDRGRCKYWRVQTSSTPDQEEDTSHKFAFYDIREIEVPPGHVKVRIQSIPVNSKHTVVSSSSDTSASIEHPLQEVQCIGVIEEIKGNNYEISNFNIGDEVIAFGQIRLASHTVCDTKFVIPKTLDYRHCTGLVPVVTAFYSLLQRARLQPDETVLINSSNDAFCLAAIDVANFIGCQVICTSMNAQHEYYLKTKVGVEKVIQISSISFKESVLRWTDNKGVDVVFISTSDHNSQKILSIMSPDGRLCNVSKGHGLQMTDISSGLLMGNKVFHSCQVDILLQHQPERFRSLVQEVMKLLKEKRLKSIPFVEYSVNDYLHTENIQNTSEVEQAVLQIPEDFDPPDLQPPLDPLSPKATYIVTDGGGSLAQILARWLYQNGARSIVFISKNDSTTSAYQTVRYLRRNNVDVQEFQTNLEFENEVKDTLQRIRSTSSKPIKGIFHLDTLISDEHPLELKAQEAGKIMSNTVARARNLHAFTKQDSLDIFLMLSSVNSLCGMPSKPISSATNAYLDALAEQRYAEGLPALSVQVGPLKCMGSVFGVSEAELMHMHYDTRQRLLHVDDFLQVLGLLLRRSDNPVVCVGEQDWGGLKQMCVNSAMKFRHLMKANVSQEKPRSATMNRRQIEHVIKSKMAELLCMRIDAIDVKRPMTAYGVDSLIAMEIANWASDPSYLGLVISQFDILDGMTIATLLNKAVSV